jgi:hypothetical protein
MDARTSDDLLALDERCHASAIPIKNTGAAAEDAANK